MKLRGSVLVFSLFLLFHSNVLPQEGKQNGRPNFSGSWLLDKEKSDLGNMGGMGRHRSGGGRMGVPGMGGPGYGIPGMGGPGMRGPRMGGGMGGPGMGDPGMGGPDMGGGTSTDTGEVNRPRMVQVPESVTIEHTDPQLVIKNKMKTENAEQDWELKYTTDGQPNTNEGPRGNSMQSKTHWKGDRLITKTSFETPNGKMELTEVRSLSPDGRTMTVELKASGGQREWNQRLVYNKG